MSRLAVAVAVLALSAMGSYLLGIRYDYGGWLFVAPFLTTAGFALVFGAAMRPAQGLVASAVLAAVLIVAFGLGLDARYWFADPSLRQGFETWVMFSLIAVPTAWLIGVGIGHLWHSTRRSRAGTP
jgi:hypothetical protein